MKLINILATGLLAIAGLTSCEMKDEIKGGKDSSEVGYLELGVSVDAKRNQVTKAAESAGSGSVGSYSADDFPVIITGVTNSEFSKKYATYKDLQSAGAIELPVGNYKIESHSAGELKDIMDDPYFAGETDLSITKGVTSNATVLCSMQNTKISLSYTSKFLASMAEWEITISDGKSILTYKGTNDNPGTPLPKYIVVAEKTSKFVVTVTGTKIDGEKVNESRNITKPEGSGSAYWGPADDLSIKMDLNEEVVVPGISGIIITVDVTFAESEETVEIDVTPEEGGGTTPEPEEPSTETDPTITSEYLDNGITLTLSKDGSEIENAPESAKVYVTAPNGINSLIIKIIAGNDKFQNAIAVMGLDKGRDLLTLNSSDQFDNALIGLVNPPSKGATDYSLDIKNFFKMMTEFRKTNESGHQFEITVKDSNGKIKSDTLKVVINQATE